MSRYCKIQECYGSRFFSVILYAKEVMHTCSHIHMRKTYLMCTKKNICIKNIYITKKYIHKMFHKCKIRFTDVQLCTKSWMLCKFIFESESANHPSVNRLALATIKSQRKTRLEVYEETWRMCHIWYLFSFQTQYLLICVWCLIC